MLQTFFSLVLLYLGLFVFIALIVVLAFFVIYIFLYAYDPSTADAEFKKFLKGIIEDLFGPSNRRQK